MCGIAGYVGRPTSREAATSALYSMAARLAHRGPDSHGIWLDDRAVVGFAHTRLAILDLSPEGHQPMMSASRRYTIAFNGEVYNFGALQRELAAAGATFRGHSDTEVLLEAIEQWGIENTLARLVGMFAIALFDGNTRQLYLIRDRLGKKPLYLAHCSSGLLFASELKALRAHPDFRAEVDRSALVSFMRHGYVPAPQCIYSGVQKVLPGSLVRISAEPPSIEAHVSYWNPRVAAAQAAASPDAPTTLVDSVERLNALLRDAVQIRMQADVPLGAFLSGGIDSSLVVSMMQAQSSRPVQTFTIGFSEATYDEAQHARAVAAFLGTEHHEHYVTPVEARTVVPELPSIYDEPFADSSQIPTYLVSKHARTRVTVALSGDGGDELFLGYSRYPAIRAAWNRTAWIPSPMRRWTGRRIRSLTPEAMTRWLGWTEALVPSFGRSRAISQTLIEVAELLEYDSRRDFYEAFRSHVRTPVDLVLAGEEVHCSADDHWLPHGSFVEQMALTDAMNYLPDDILVKVDRASMAVSLEVRAPLLDHRVAEFAWSLPTPFKLAGTEGKIVLKKLLNRYLPAHLVDRPKSGFAVPMRAWLRGPLQSWMQETLSDERIRRDGYLEPCFVRRLIDEHVSGRRNRDAVLWDLLMFCGWLDAQ